MVFRIAKIAQTDACDAIVDLLDGGAGAGTFDCYDGAQPATPQAAATGNYAVQITLNDPAFGAASTAGVATMDPTPTPSGTVGSAPATATATTTVTWGRFSDNTTPTANAVFDVSIGEGGQDINFDETDFQVNGTAKLTSLTVTVPMS